MHYTLAPGVSACVADGRLVFLNLKADRYLMVEPRAEALLLDGRGKGCCHYPELDRLCELGLLVRSRNVDDLPLCAATGAEGSLFDTPWQRPSPYALAGAGGAVVAATASLRWRGLARTVRGLAERSDPDLRNLDLTLRHAAAFAELRLAVRTLNRCLPLSVALARRTRATDREVKLVIGVKLGPFGAHAWVQRGSLVLNDRLDAVRAFTPILVA